jgi:hypothetical protein
MPRSEIALSVEDALPVLSTLAEAGEDKQPIG